ncbi:2-nitropropane dioxygenase [Acrocarpospora pleiomorpha]|uniref:2-nitropropane dioxygenase n=1 Tax=Acrocarpospora pleiomorpha TaxID=90975 RepID=A0A5M3XCT1_9ACTN|nr:nitronate monooxygenase family protein [Acrocarpospora pleiomorpha]GES17321.1 2-nitropropane dioxygenase [Acrocarpospora pleiomorpha]
MTASLPTRFTQLLGIEHPVMQDGMGSGSFTTGDIAAAVSAAGGLGSVSTADLWAEPAKAERVFRGQMELVASRTDKPFAANIPIGVDHSGDVIGASTNHLNYVIQARREDPALERQLRVVTTSGGPPDQFRAVIRDAGLLHFHKVGSTRQALRAERAGVDLIIASGFEMGGHTHSKPVHTFVLGPNVTEAVEVPVLISGGVRDARGLAAALCFGADGVAMGTRFIATEESNWHPAIVARVLEAKEGDDTLFPGIYGPIRGLRNEAVRLLQKLIDEGATPEEITEWKAAAFRRVQDEGDVHLGLFPTGQVASGITEVVRIPDLVSGMVSGAAAILARLAGPRPVS